MAGRGRNMTLPAWMTTGGEDFTAKSHSASNDIRSTLNSSHRMEAPGQYDDAFPNVSHTNSFEHRGQVENLRDFSSTRSSESGRDQRDTRRDDDYHDRKRKSRSREKDRKQRKNSRSRSRDRPRYRSSRDRDSRKSSKSPDMAPKEWVSRKKRSSNFDVKPENGIPLPPLYGMPGALTAESFAHPLNPLISNGAGLSSRGGGGSSSSGGGGSTLANNAYMMHTKHARRLYVGGIPPGSTTTEVSDFFLDTYRRALPPGSPDAVSPIIDVYINHEKCFAFVELTSVELTSAGCLMDGLQFKGATLKIKRPNDFRPELLPNHVPTPVNLSALGVTSTTVADGPNKVFVGGLPYHLNDENVKELLMVFGPLKSFHLVKEAGSSNSKGYAFCEFADLNHTRIACSGLNNMQIGEKTLTVRIANQTSGSNNNIQQSNIYGNGGAVGAVFNGPNTLMSALPNFSAIASSIGAAATSYGGGGASNYNPFLTSSVPGVAGGYHNPAVIMNHKQPTRVIVLMNMVMAEELKDDNEHKDICDDVGHECSQYGEVTSLIIPRAKEGYPSRCEGSVFVEFLNADMAAKASKALAGKKFATRLVEVDYFDEQKYKRHDLVI